MTLHFQKITSPVGPLYLVASTESLLAVCLENNWLEQKKSWPNLTQKKTPLLTEAKKQLTEYFQKKRTTFDLPIRLQGTAFQIQTWKSLQKIPYGKTISYSDQAKLIQNPKAVRAVGRTNGLNPLCIILPCHRVVGKSGKLTGYAGGLDIKEFLLQLER